MPNAIPEAKEEEEMLPLPHYVSPRVSSLSGEKKKIRITPARRVISPAPAVRSQSTSSLSSTDVSSRLAVIRERTAVDDSEVGSVKTPSSRTPKKKITPLHR